MQHIVQSIRTFSKSSMSALSGRWALLTPLDALATLAVSKHGVQFTDRCKNAVYISSAINDIGKAAFSTFSVDAQFYRQASALITRRFYRSYRKALRQMSGDLDHIRTRVSFGHLNLRTPHSSVYRRRRSLTLAVVHGHR